jgi:hypothetical protein
VGLRGLHDKTTRKDKQPWVAAVLLVADAWVTRRIRLPPPFNRGPIGQSQQKQAQQRGWRKEEECSNVSLCGVVWCVLCVPSHCTDVLFLLLYIASFGGMLGQRA